jgi:hypothetical protein
MIHEFPEGGGELVIENETKKSRDVVYASVTAPKLARVEVRIDDEICDVVYVGNGSSHSWWTPAGGKFFDPNKFPKGQKPGAKLVVKCDGRAAIRIDWYD